MNKVGQLLPKLKVQNLNPNKDIWQGKGSENQFFPASIWAESRENNTHASVWAFKINFGKKQVQKTGFFMPLSELKAEKTLYVLLFELLLDWFLGLLHGFKLIIAVSSLFIFYLYDKLSLFFTNCSRKICFLNKNYLDLYVIEF